MSIPSDALSITDGPSALDIIIALAKCYGDNPFRVKMMVQYPDQIGIEHVVAIQGLTHEDGSGHNWLFKGFLVGTSPREPERNPVEGYFSTATRKGWLRFV